MNIPYKQMFNWKTGAFAPTILGIWYILAPFLGGGAINERMLIFGFTFLGIGIIKTKTAPSVISSFFTAFLGISYMMFVMTTISDAILWTLSIVFFAVILVLEFGIFKFGPSAVQGNDLALVPLTIFFFAIVLGLAGYNPYIIFNFNRQFLVAVNYIAVMVFCFLWVSNRIGYRPMGAKTNLWMNIMAIAVVVCSLVGFAQGALFSW